MTPYPFQETAITAGVGFFTNPKVSKPKLMVLPTGTGKSLVIAEIAARLNEKVLVFQPSAEILMQNYRKYVAIDQNVEIFSASLKRRRFARVTFVTLGSIKNIADLFREYKYLIIDECHLYPSRKESMFSKFLKENPQLKILGLTATPFRLQSGFNFSRLEMMHRNHIYNEYVHITQIQEIAEKYWSPLKYVVQTGDKAVLKTDNGVEYTDESLEIYFHTVEDKVLYYADMYKDESKFIFVPSIKTAEELSEQIPNSAVISAYTKRGERDQIFADFISGKLKAILNVNVLGVGIDMPFLKFIIDANPTMSLARQYQKIGRLTRRHTSKTHGTIIDLAGGVEKFGKIEELELRKLSTTYHMFSGGKQLTGVNLKDISFGFDPQDPEEPFIDVALSFGKFKGIRISEIPSMSYYSWIIDFVTWDDVLVRNTKIFVERNKAMIQELL